MPHLYFACNKITSRLKRLSYFFSPVLWVKYHGQHGHKHTIPPSTGNGVSELLISELINSRVYFQTQNFLYMLPGIEDSSAQEWKFNTFIEVTESDVVELVEAPNDIPTVSAMIFWLPRGLSSMPSWDMSSLQESLFDVYWGVVIGIFKYSTKEMVKPKFNFTLFLFVVVVCMCFWTHKQLFLFCFLWHTCSSQTPTTNRWFIE